jgi:hypothetical protein
MAAPATTGVITGVRLRLSASPYGAAIHVDVNDLEAIETATAGRFYYVVDKTLLTTHVLPLGAGASFYAVWSKSGDMDNESVEFVVASGTQN